MSAFVEAASQLVQSYGGDYPDLYNFEWRHHGLGMLQADFSNTLRFHIWHPSLVSKGMVWPRRVHDHRFDIVSAVVVGEVMDVPYNVVETDDTMPLPGWMRVHVFEIEHAKNQDRLVEKGYSTATSAKKLSQADLQEKPFGRQTVTAGAEYRIARRQFHTTLVNDLAITVIHRSNFDDRLARVLCAPDSDVTAVSGIVRDDSSDHRLLVNSVLQKAAHAIAKLS